MSQPVAKQRPQKTVLENLAERYAEARKIMAAEGISIKHFRQIVTISGEAHGLHNGGTTVAFRQLKSDSFVEVATALCGQNDIYNRKAGTVVAVEQFMNQRRIRLPLHGRHPADVVELFFRESHFFS